MDDEQIFYAAEGRVFWFMSAMLTIRHTSGDGIHHIPRQSPLAELSFVTLTIHLCNGLNDKNLVKLGKTCFLTV